MTTITCTFCGSTAGDEAPSLGKILQEPGYEPEFFGDRDYERCDECGRWCCMACAVFDFSDVGGHAMRYLCPDCGEETAEVMRRIGAPKLPLKVEL